MTGDGLSNERVGCAGAWLVIRFGYVLGRIVYRAGMARLGESLGVGGNQVGPSRAVIKIGMSYGSECGGRPVIGRSGNWGRVDAACQQGLTR
jgi:hypothetical protein